LAIEISSNFQKCQLFVFSFELPTKPGHSMALSGYSSSEKKYSSVPAKKQQMVTLVIELSKLLFKRALNAEVSNLKLFLGNNNSRV